METFNSKQKNIKLIDIISEEYQLEIYDYLKQRHEVDNSLAWLLELLTVKAHISIDYSIQIVACVDKYSIPLDSIIEYLETNELISYSDIIEFISIHLGISVNNEVATTKYSDVNFKDIARDTRELNIMLVACISEGFQEEIRKYLAELYVRELSEYLQECS